MGPRRNGLRESFHSAGLSRGRGRRASRHAGAFASSPAVHLVGSPRRTPGASDHLQEIRVDAVVAGQLGMERRAQHVLLADHHAVAVALGERLDVRAGALDPRRANEHRRKRLARRAPGSRAGLRRESTWRPNALRRTVTSIRSSVGCSMSATSCAATIIPMHVPQNGIPPRTRSLDRLGQTEPVQQADHGRRLAAGDDERVDAARDRRASAPRRRARRRAPARARARSRHLAAPTRRRVAGTQDRERSRTLRERTLISA